MRIFLTGATGFIGTHIIPQLLGAGHQVLGMTRSDAGAKTLIDAGVEPYRATLEDPDSMGSGAAQADATIHCAFDHDFSNFMANVQKDRAAIQALGEALAGSGKPLVITSGTGTGMGSPGPGQLATEDVFDANNPNPRIASETTAAGFIDKGVKTIVVRLPQVHDTRKQGLISPMIETARVQGRVAYVGNGENRWAAAPVKAVAELYRLAVEQGQAGERFHAVKEEGVTARDIATVLGAGLGLPVVSLSPDEVAGYFGPFALFAGLDMPASSAWTRKRLGWEPKGPSLIEDLQNMDYGPSASG
jgi:nucleoside-diphosphate-sugar epimerase